VNVILANRKRLGPLPGREPPESNTRLRTSFWRNQVGDSAVSGNSVLRESLSFPGPGCHHGRFRRASAWVGVSSD
jgi:hypothetical protein